MRIPIAWVATLLSACPAGLSQSGKFQTTTGSGFLVTTAGHVVTNSHVVQGCSSVSVRLNGRIIEASLIAEDRENDLALLQVQGPMPPGLAFRTDQRIRLGESVVVVGFPLQGVTASSVSLTTGTISALAGIRDDARMLQFTAPVQPGNSGGPMLDQAGKVIGVVTNKLSAAWAARVVGDIPQNVNFAVRGSVLKAFLDSRGVEYINEAPGPKIETADIAERASQSTFLVECLGRIESPLPSSSRDPAAAPPEKPKYLVMWEAGQSIKKTPLVGIQKRYLLAEWKSAATGDHHFAVELYDSEGAVVGLLVNEINKRSGRSVIQVPRPGKYYCSVTTGKRWTLQLYELDRLPE